MNVAHLIARKRDGFPLSPSEIAWLVEGYVQGETPDYQMAALAMAIYWRGMDAEETAALTESMLRSGVVLAWPEADAPYVDKHSCGGVGDKISLILAPLLACCGLRVPMISGRGLGATGGTLDKLESIPGYRTNLSIDEIQHLTERVGCVITGATSEIAPADKKLYALRDVTATVASIPLITASILSKKLAEGLQALVLDVKFGSGAFMKTREDATRLAQSLVSVAHRMGVPTTALLTDMNQPNGLLAGNAVEVNEALTTLSGEGPSDVRELTLALGAELLVITGSSESLPAARQQLAARLDDGSALEKFREMVHAQGGDLQAPRCVAPSSEVTAEHGGYVVAMNTEQLGMAIVELGGGRKKVGDQVDHSVGLEMLARRGEEVEVGQPLARVFARPADFARVASLVRDAIQIGASPPEPLPLVVARLTSTPSDAHDETTTRRVDRGGAESAPKGLRPLFETPRRRGDSDE